MEPNVTECEISPAELHDWLGAGEAGEGPLLVDCREEDEYAFCRIEGAVLMPLSRFSQEVAGRWGGPGTPGSRPGEEGGCPVVVYCHHGMRSLHATTYLRERGRPRVWSLAGGIERWSTEIDPAVPRY